MEKPSDLMKVTALFGYSNHNRFGRGNIGDPRVAFFLPKTRYGVDKTVYREDGVFFYRLKAKDKRMKWYEDSLKDQQTNDVRGYIQEIETGRLGKEHFDLEKICEVKIPELELDIFKQRELLRNSLRKLSKTTIDKYFTPVVVALKKKLFI